MYDNDEEVLAQLELAWSRLTTTPWGGTRGFVTIPGLSAWFRADKDAWLGRLLSELRRGYTPKACQLCLTPKPGYMVRTGAVLHPDDAIIYTFLVGRLYGRVWDALEWSQGNPDVSYQLYSPAELEKQPAKSAWMRSGPGVWKGFREKSLVLLAAPVSHMLSTDITGYYDNIDVAKLMSDLRGLRVHDEELRLLAACLNRWSNPRNRGIPQGYAASDILGKVYLNELDRALSNEGFRHLRYVDDVRVFCESQKQAKEAILVLTEVTTQRSLNLQSAKTFIYSAEAARAKFDAVERILAEVGDELREDMISAGFDSSSTPEGAVFEWLKTSEDDSSRETLEAAFQRHFIDAADDRFDATLLHYLLNRLAAAGSQIAISYCIDTLKSRPEETVSILKYLGQMPMQAVEAQLLAVLESPDSIYDYQLYQLVEWFLTRDHWSERLLNVCRRFAYDQNRDSWLRLSAVIYLGKFGNPGDLSKIEQRYSALSDDVEQAVFVSALTRLETGRRNGFYARLQADGPLVAAAVKAVKSGVLNE